MAAQVLSGTSNVSYTNNTGQNVRIVINFMEKASNNPLTISWSASSGGTVSISESNAKTIGRNLAYASGQGTHGSNMVASGNIAFPTELMIAAGQVFSAICGAYNIVIIPENG